MLLLILEAAGARYGVPAGRIVEVLPATALRPLPGTPAFVPGAFSYHGSVVPVIDLSALLSGRPARPLFSTRILLVNVQPLQMPGPVLLGFLAEHATETVACARGELQPPGVRASDAPYAGDILVRPGGLIQVLDLDRVLAADLQEQLFRGAAAHA